MTHRRAKIDYADPYGDWKNRHKKRKVLKARRNARYKRNGSSFLERAPGGDCPLCGGNITQIPRTSSYRYVICEYNPGRVVWDLKKKKYEFRQCTYGAKKL